MAVLILGKTKCPICNSLILDSQEVVSFPPFVGNELDPLYLFHDSAFHEECFRLHPLAEPAIVLSTKMQTKTAPANRLCEVCSTSISEPDDYFTVGYLVSDSSNALFPLNYAQLHRSCIPKWKERACVKEFLTNLRLLGKWKGNSLNWVLESL